MRALLPPRRPECCAAHQTSAAPPGTDLVILQPGGNDLRFFGTREQRAANIGAIERRLRERGIKLIVFDPVFPPEYFSFDRIHFTTAAHAQIAAELVPLVTAALQKSKQPRKSLEPAGHGRSFQNPASVTVALRRQQRGGHVRTGAYRKAPDQAQRDLGPIRRKLVGTVAQPRHADRRADHIAKALGLEVPLA